MASDLNDSFVESVSIGALTTTAKTVSASISPDIDVNIYRFTVVAGQVVDFDIDTVLNGPGGLDSYLKLFNSQGEQLAYNDDDAAPGENHIGFDTYLRYTFPTAGTNYVAVSNSTNNFYDPFTGAGDTAGGLNSTGDYQLIVKGLPVDPDDSLAEASLLGAISSASKTANGRIDPDIDVDMFRFTVVAGQVVDFDIDTTSNGGTGLDSYLKLFNSLGQQLAWNDAATAPGENQVGYDAYLRYGFATAGTYYVGVSNTHNDFYDQVTGGGDTAGGFHSIGDYSLIVRTAPVIPVDPDDALAEAASLGAISTTAKTVNASITPDVDVDMYRFTVAAGQAVDFDIDTSLNGPGGLGSYLKLFDSQGQQLAYNDDGAAPGENQIGFDAYLRFTFTAAGTFYVGVSNANNNFYNPLTGEGDTAGGLNSTGTYQLSVKALPVDPDDTLAEATSLGTISTTAKTVNASITPDIDVDMFRFTVVAGQVVDFDIDTTSNGGAGLDSYLKVFDAHGQQLAWNDDAAAPGENQVGYDAYLRYGFATAGTYYVGVSNTHNDFYDQVTGGGDTAGGFHSIGDYSLIVRTAPVIPVDPDDTLAEAASLGAISTTAKTVNASITPDVDVDMYRFTVAAGQAVDFDIDTSLNGPGGLGSYLKLFDSQGQQLAYNDDGAAPGENHIGFDAYLRFTFTAAGTFYVGVSNANNNLYDPLTGEGDTAGGLNSTGTYQLSVKALPVDPDDALAEATSLGAMSTTAKTVNASITPDVDVDMYRFSVAADQVVDFDIDTSLNGPGGLGSYLKLFDSQGQQLAYNDDAAAPGENQIGFDAYLRFTFPTAGTYYVGVSNANNSFYSPTTGEGDTAGGFHSIGDYSLTLQALPGVVPTLAVTIVPSSIAEYGGVATGQVTRSNANLSQALTVFLTNSDPSEANVASQIVIAANQSSATFSILAVDDHVVDGSQSVTITATSAGYSAGFAVLQIADSDATWHNAANPFDVDGDGVVTPIDALLIVNFLNSIGPGPLPAGSPPPYLDVNSDNLVSPIDALMVINALNGAGGEGEGGMFPATTHVQGTPSISFDPNLPHDAHRIEAQADAARPQLAERRTIASKDIDAVLVDDHRSRAAVSFRIRPSGELSAVLVDDFFAELGSKFDVVTVA